MTYEDKLQEIAIANVGPLTYPDPTDTSALQASITEKQASITLVKTDQNQRPSTYGGFEGRQAYQAYLQDLQDDITDLRNQISDIRALDTAARAEAESDWNDAIAAEKLKPEVIAAAEAAAFEEDYKTRLGAIEQAILDLGEAIL